MQFLACFGFCFDQMADRPGWAGSNDTTNSPDGLNMSKISMWWTAFNPRVRNVVVTLSQYKVWLPAKHYH